MALDKRNYTLVWKLMPARWTARWGAGAPGAIPYFVDGDAYRRFRAGEPLHLEEEMLFRGVLHAWLDTAEKWQNADRSALDRFLARLLAVLHARTRCDSFAVMVLSSAAKVRERNGRLPAMKMLLAGHRLLPASAEIRADLIMDLWAIVEASDQVDRRAAFELIGHLYNGMAFEHLGEGVRDLVDYVHFVALSRLGDFQKRNWLFWRVISRRVRHTHLKHRMIRLLNCRPMAVALPCEEGEARLKAG